MISVFDSIPKDEHLEMDPVFAGLQALASASFPKRCATCGREYPDVASYVQATEGLPNGRRGFKQSVGDEGEIILELFRNCPCGSTLMDCFSDRRDASTSGLLRRERFGDLVATLVQRGLSAELARTELLRVMRGESSPIIRASAEKNRKRDG